jgi:Nuclease-related domain
MGRRAGEWVTLEARRHERPVWLLAAVFFFAAGMIGVAGFMLESSLLVLLLLGGVVALRPFANRQADVSLRWRRGAHAERAVGERLEELRGEGFVVVHDLEQAREGNVDHLVSGPSGVFMVETKWRRYEDAHLRKAKRQAAKLAHELGVWVTPVLALANRADREPYRHDGVWVVTAGRLIPWLLAQRQPRVDIERLARLAERA